jgi:predicted nucleotidyltransferase
MKTEPAFDLGAKETAMVKEILQAHLPEGAAVNLVGSRANGRAKPYSDVDLLVDAGRPLSPDEDRTLRFVFEDSDLPYKVDIIDRHSISHEFRAAVEQGQMIKLDLN